MRARIPGLVYFVSTLPESWGGSEYLWSRTALHIAHLGKRVSVSMEFRRSEPAIVAQLKLAGAEVEFRNSPPPVPPPAHIVERCRRLVVRKLFRRPYSQPTELQALQKKWPDLVVISQPTCIEGLPWMQACQQLGIPYVTIAQACHDLLFHSDSFADQIESALLGAMRSYFVAEDNRIRLETFLARSFPAAEVIRNPFKVPYDLSLPWPDPMGPLRLANVARLHIPSKGQDILLRVLSLQKWRDRDLIVDFFGAGDNERRLKQLAVALSLRNVHFHGHVEDIAAVWKEHHALLLPSRHEGLPIALVEAMLCGRPAVVTDVAGNSEVMMDSETGFIAAAPTVSAFDMALERLWEARDRLQQMGLAAATHIRTLVPADPVGEFADRLLSLVPLEKSN